MFSPISKKRIYIAIAEEILTMIRNGHFQEGKKLPTERDLANLFKVSRASVREALSALQFIGVVDSKVGNGTYVARSSAAPARGLALLEKMHSPFDILEARELVEPIIAALAAERRDDGDLNALRDVLTQMESEIASNRYDPRTDQHFHLTLAGASQNQVLEGMMKYLFSLTDEQFWRIVKGPIERVPSNVQRYLHQHAQIYDAVARGDAEAASRAMRDHLKQVIEDILEEERQEEDHG